MSNLEKMREKIRKEAGFIAALDQSGGSTPKALRAYGIEDDAWSSDGEMFDMVHAMRTRIITDKAFDGTRILGAILFENTMDRQIEGRSTTSYLWEEKRVVPFLKIDKGLCDEAQGVRMMKPIPELDTLLRRAHDHGVFGTKERSVVLQADAAGIDAIVAQQFELGQQVLAAGLVPILEPEIDIHCPEKAQAEKLLKASILRHLDSVSEKQPIMLKLTLPDEDGMYRELIDHPKVLRVVALSGGYPREDANKRLARQHGMIASFSRALIDGLSAKQSDEAFHKTLDTAIQSIYEASKT